MISGRRDRRARPWAARGRRRPPRDEGQPQPLVRTLPAEALVDELQRIRMPVMLGGGRTIFPEGGMKRPLDHVSTTTAKTGVDISVYRPVRED
ncbi:hypothetical protein [Streptomyces sp. NPDC091209]|uniref:hypothetical protein n=1 Tax=Streptomyces sp. NPDC091209 TaxID=3365974 RepID=UPI00382A1E19